MAHKLQSKFANDGIKPYFKKAALQINAQITTKERFLAVRQFNVRGNAYQWHRIIPYLYSTQFFSKGKIKSYFAMFIQTFNKRSVFNHILLLLTLLIGLTYCTETKKDTKMAATASSAEVNSNFDWQGHRGARGLMPENTIPAFLEALRYPIKTLEMDVAISGDSQVIITHEPWFSATICSSPSGEGITEDTEKSYRIIDLTYQQIRAFDCGSKKHPRFQEQQHTFTHKPNLSDVVVAVHNFCTNNRREKPSFNIEIKSDPNWDNIFTPVPEVFVRLVIDELERLGITKNTTLQSFDLRVLQQIQSIDSSITLALLVDADESGDDKLKDLGFIPAIYSPYFKQLDKQMVEHLHTRNMKVIPWTVNEVSDMKALISMGVDGIITDYPNRIEQVNK